MGLFNLSGPKKHESDAKSFVHEKNIHEFVKEIHDAFENELSHILTAANIKESLEELNESLLKKSTQLRSLGFINTPEVLEINELIKINDVTIKENNKKDELIEGINYFRQKYPLYKIITMESLNELCEKYQLGYAAIRAYKGSVPQKNIDVLLNCKITDRDKAVIHYYISNDKEPKKYLYDSDLARYEHSLNFASSQGYIKKHYDDKHIIFSPLVIAAPPNDFTDSMQKTERFGKLQPIKNLEDPIVMQPVSYLDKIYMLIITAWGPEASDPNVVNELFN
jgi:NAD-dependent DNA ligase